MYGQYILGGDDGKTPVPCDDLLMWGMWLQTSHAERRVGDTTVGGYLISTVFLGLDHAFGGGPPMLFETMVFEPPAPGEKFGHDVYCERSSTWADAERQHAAAAEYVCVLLLRSEEITQAALRRYAV